MINTYTYCKAVFLVNCSKREHIEVKSNEHWIETYEGIKQGPLSSSNIFPEVLSIK